MCAVEPLTYFVFVLHYTLLFSIYVYILYICVFINSVVLVIVVFLFLLLLVVVVVVVVLVVVIVRVVVVVVVVVKYHVHFPTCVSHTSPYIPILTLAQGQKGAPGLENFTR